MGTPAVDEEWEVVHPGQAQESDWVPVEQAGPAPKPQHAPVSGGMAFARGVGQGATFGFGDEFSGLVRAGLEKVAPSNPDLPMTAREAYQETRDAEREENRAAEAQHAGKFFAGNVAGGMLVPVPGGASGGVLKAGARLAGQGALMGAGASEATDAAGLAKDTAVGAGVGLAAGGVLHGAVKAGGKVLQGGGQLAQRLSKSAVIQRLLAAGIDPNNPKQMGNFTPEEMVARLESQEVGGGFKSTATIGEEAAAAAEKAEARRGELVQAFEKANKRPDANVIAAMLSEQAKKEAGPVGKKLVERTNVIDEVPSVNPDKAPLVKALQDRAGYFKDLGRASPKGLKFSEANQLRADYGKRAKFGTDSPEAAVRQDVHKAINDEMERVAGDQAEGKLFRELGRDQAAAIAAREGAEKAAIKAEKRPFLQGGVVEALGRRVNHSARATGLEAGAAVARFAGRRPKAVSAIGKALQSRPAATATRAVARALSRVQNSPNPAKTHFLEQQTNPEYREYVVDEE